MESRESMQAMQAVADDNDRRGGRPTQETVILACQCGSTAFREEKRTQKAVVFTCAKCSERTSVQGRAAFARVASDEATFAVHQKLVMPDPSATPGSPKKPSLSEQGFEYIRSRVTTGADGQGAAIRRACEVMRVTHCNEPEMRQHMWLGTALTYICADYMSGADQRAIRIVDAQEEAVADEIARMEARGRKTTRKRISILRNNVRDALAQQLGLVAAPAADPAAQLDQIIVEARALEDQRREERAAAAEDPRMLDDWRLMDALINARAEFARDSGLPINSIMLGDATRYAAFCKAQIESGGFLLRVIGDERTRTPSGVRPSVLMLAMAEDDVLEEHFDFTQNYLDQFEDDGIDNLAWTIVELLPADYGQPDEDGQPLSWTMPRIASTREVMK